MASTLIYPDKTVDLDTITITWEEPVLIPDGMTRTIHTEGVHCAKASLARPRISRILKPILTPAEDPRLIKSTHEVEDIIKEASFPGGDRALEKYISKNAVYPTAVAQQGIVGTVGVEFLVRANGHIAKVKTIQSAHPLLDAEAVRLVSSMPPWNPTVVNGRKKAFYYEVYIVFSW